MNFTAKIAELTDQLSTLTNAHSTLQASHKNLTESLSTANAQLAAANEQVTKLTAELATANATISELKPKAEKTAEQIKAGIVEGIASAGVPPVARVETPDKVEGEEKPKLTGMAKAAAYFAERADKTGAV